MTKFFQVLFLLSVITVGDTMAQRFTGFQAAKRASEYEAQRFLISKGFVVPSETVGELEIDRCAEYISKDEGVIFLLTAFHWKETTGVVLTSLVSRADSFCGDGCEFVNIELPEKEFDRLNRTFSELADMDRVNGSHRINRFDSGLIGEYVNDVNGKDVRLWFGGNRHSFSFDDWNAFYKRFAQFKHKVNKK